MSAKAIQGIGADVIYIAFFRLQCLLERGECAARNVAGIVANGIHLGAYAEDLSEQNSDE